MRQRHQHHHPEWTALWRKLIFANFILGVYIAVFVTIILYDLYLH